MSGMPFANRRIFVAAASASLFNAALDWPAAAWPRADTPPVDPFRPMETQTGGRVGVMAVDTGGGRSMSSRPDERFPMCSTFKWLLTAAILARVDSRRLSHNTAANLLLQRVDGPAGVTHFLRRIGDHTTRLDRNEPSLNTNLPHDDRDTTTPRAMAATMNTLLLGTVLATDSRTRLIEWLKACRTGQERLRAGLPADWVTGDKTGTGDGGAVNDLAIAWPPGKAPILIAAYLSGSSLPVDSLSLTHVRIARIVAERFAVT